MRVAPVYASRRAGWWRPQAPVGELCRATVASGGVVVASVEAESCARRKAALTEELGESCAETAEGRQVGQRCAPGLCRPRACVA